MSERKLTPINSEYTGLRTSAEEFYADVGGDKLIYFPDSIFRPLRKSEFKNILRDRSWNKDTCVVLKTEEGGIDKQYYLCPYTSGFFPSGDIDWFSQEEMDSLNFKMTGPDRDNTGSAEIAQIFRDLIQGDDPLGESKTYPSEENYSEVYYWLSYINTQTIELLSSSSYVNHIDLGRWIKRASGHSIHVDAKVDILYSMSGNIYQYNTALSLLNYDSSGNLLQKDFVLRIDENVQLDLIGGVLTVSALSNRIDECIINKCMLIYGK